MNSCTKCHYSARKLSELVLHYRFNHQQEHDFQISCQVHNCAKTFKLTESYLKHVKRKHKDFHEEHFSRWKQFCREPDTLSSLHEFQNDHDNHFMDHDGDPVETDQNQAENHLGFEFKHEYCDNCQKHCKCEECTDKLILACDETAPSNMKKNKLYPSIKEQLDMVLMEYFNAENKIIAMLNSELIPGLSDLFAKEICQEHILYSDKEQIVCRHTTLFPHIVENIALIVRELCLK
ncbi:unnamed protein product [Mytilus coruscus]|uniref:C2H2-type domain-containing protein n=1 Tax=Mytilus coruscus TaxID=42192 RepID=A0A6J8BGV7_MYTCO|nr:unnamed protein product [Mytilus coruscus]